LDPQDAQRLEEARTLDAAEVDGLPALPLKFSLPARESAFSVPLQSVARTSARGAVVAELSLEDVRLVR